jgi:hypothetical protein
LAHQTKREYGDRQREADVHTLKRGPTTSARNRDRLCQPRKLVDKKHDSGDF